MNRQSAFSAENPIAVHAKSTCRKKAPKHPCQRDAAGEHCPAEFRKFVIWLRVMSRASRVFGKQD
jgi:hypothetical protein